MSLSLYKIISHYDQNIVTNKVNTHMKDGWFLYGDLKVVMTSSVIYYTQVLITDKSLIAPQVVLKS